jgi:hypothetical protein
MLAGATFTIVVALGLAQAAALPDDARLQPVRARLESLVADTAKAGLPAELLVSKVREGLAKGVPAERIQIAAGRLAESLKMADAFVRERRPGATPPVELVRALAEARMAGVELAAADSVVRSGRPTAETARAVEVLTDLTLRGYPTGRAAGLLRDVFARDAASVGRLPATLEVLRREQALTHAETLDAIARGMEGTGSLDAASMRAADEERRKGGGKSKPGGGGQGDPGGKENFVPPGQLKKQAGAKGRPANPGLGRGMGGG